MIALLTGTIAHKSPDAVIVDVHGVGYRVQIPFSTYYELPAEGGDVILQIHTHVKEDAIQLYGFRTPAEKELFQLLIAVSGVGPKLAVNILSNIGAEELAHALARGDLARLAMIPGIGKKTGERLVLELKEKVKKLTTIAQPQEPARPQEAAGVLDDVASALVNLGYKEAVVSKALADLVVPADAAMEQVLKQALKKLMR
ncbi:MAG TPA: Holliday junction branch migration protein RuvA [Geobacteraceae bacterium]